MAQVQLLNVGQLRELQVLQLLQSIAGERELTQLAVVGERLGVDAGQLVVGQVELDEQMQATEGVRVQLAQSRARQEQMLQVLQAGPLQRVCLQPGHTASTQVQHLDLGAEPGWQTAALPVRAVGPLLTIGPQAAAAVRTAGGEVLGTDRGGRRQQQQQQRQRRAARPRTTPLHLGDRLTNRPALPGAARHTVL